MTTPTKLNNLLQKISNFKCIIGQINEKIEITRKETRCQQKCEK